MSKTHVKIHTISTEPATVYSNYCMLSQTKKVKPVKAMNVLEEPK